MNQSRYLRKLVVMISFAVIESMMIAPKIANAQTKLPNCPADTKILWTNCYGTRSFNSGEKYIGEWKDGFFDGSGILYAPNGGIFKEGQWSNGVLAWGRTVPTAQNQREPQTAAEQCAKRLGDAQILACNEAIRLNPKDHYSHHNRALAFWRDGDLERAVQSFDETTRLTPSFPNAYYNRGLVREKQGEFFHALADFIQYVQLVPSDNDGMIAVNRMSIAVNSQKTVSEQRPITPSYQAQQQPPQQRPQVQVQQPQPQQKLNSNNNTSAGSQGASDPVAERRLHMNDPIWLGEKYTTEASIFCKDEIEKLARYKFEWTDGWSELKFNQYNKSRTFGPGIIRVYGDKIKFQNGFGAFQSMTYQCDYDAINMKATNAQAFAK